MSRLIFFFIMREKSIVLGKWRDTETPGKCKKRKHPLLSSLPSSQYFRETESLLSSEDPIGGISL